MFRFVRYSLLAVCAPAVFAVVASPLLAQGSHASTDTLPNDTAVTVGTLPNGMRYYVRTNKKPEHRAELRLVVKAGSLMEDDDQRGLAHFVEHMAFRGTTHFQGTQIVDYLKSIGVRFGADLNATTEFEKTTYILPLPTDTLTQLKRGLQIMEDWAHGVTFPQKDIDDERGIILGERRMHLGVGSRIQDQQIPVMFKGSRYPDRLPIGTKESVTNATRDQIVRFYTKWYRPDRMAIVAVGDFDKAQMIQLIKDQFSKIPAATTPLADPKFPIPPQPGTLVSVVSDPEITNTNVQLMYKGPGYPRKTVAAERAGLVRATFDGMLNERIQELLQKPDAPFLGGGVGHSEIVPEVSAVVADAAVSSNGAVKGLDGVLTEVARVAQHGFTDTELARQKQTYLTQLEHAYENRNDRYSEEFVDAYINNFLLGDGFPSIEDGIALTRQIVPTLTLDEINREAGFWKSTDNRVLLITQPKDSATQVPDTAALLALVNTVASRSVAAYVDEASNNDLLDHPPTPGKVVAEKQYPKIGVTEWTLSNGATVFVKPTTFKANEVLFSATSPGGQSLLPDADFPSAIFMNEIAGAGGLGRFSQVALGKRLSGKVVSMGAGVAATSEILQGSSSNADVESMFQLAYLQMTAPRYDSAAVAALAQRAKIGLANRSADPGSVFGDTVSLTLTHHSKRAPVVNSALIDQINTKQAFEMYKSRFTGADDFTFMLVGAFSLDSIKPLVERYIGGLPSTKQHEQIKDRPEFHAPAGVVHKTVVAGQEPKTATIVRFSGPYETSRQNANDMRLMTQVLSARLENRLREQMAGTYGVGVSDDRDAKPISEYSITVQFDADPARRDELTKAMFAEIDSLKRVPPSAEELHRVIAPELRTRERARRTNEYWLNVLHWNELGWDLDGLLDDSLVQSTTPAQIQKAAQRYLDVQHYQQFDLLPATATTAQK